MAQAFSTLSSGSETPMFYLESDNADGESGALLNFSAIMDSLAHTEWNNAEPPPSPVPSDLGPEFGEDFSLTYEMESGVNQGYGASGATRASSGLRIDIPTALTSPLTLSPHSPAISTPEHYYSPSPSSSFPSPAFSTHSLPVDSPQVQQPSYAQPELPPSLTRSATGGIIEAKHNYGQFLEVPRPVYIRPVSENIGDPRISASPISPSFPSPSASPLPFPSHVSPLSRVPGTSATIGEAIDVTTPIDAASRGILIPQPRAYPWPSDNLDGFFWPSPGSASTMSSWGSHSTGFLHQPLPDAPVAGPSTGTSTGLNVPVPGLSPSHPGSPFTVAQHSVYSPQPSPGSPSSPLPPPQVSRVGSAKMDAAAVSRRKPGKRVIPCPYCAKTITSRANLQYHINRHFDLKPFICQFCQAAFCALPTRDKHLRTCKSRPARHA